MSIGGKLTIEGEPRALPSSVGFVVMDQAYFRTVGIP
jgi:hypothetical protein